MEITSLFKKEIVSNGGKLMTKQRRFAYTSLTPILLYMGLFTLFPIVWAVVMSFFSYTPIREGSGFLGLGGANPFIGIDNYIELFTGTSKPAEVFRLAVKNTFLFTALVLPLNLIVTLPLAVILESIGERFKTLFRAIYFLPTISSSVALVIIWSYMYAPRLGHAQPHVQSGRSRSAKIVAAGPEHSVLRHSTGQCFALLSRTFGRTLATTSSSSLLPCNRSRRLCAKLPA
jgi:ABC-type sugar transport system permease subunit